MREQKTLGGRLDLAIVMIVIDSILYAVYLYAPTHVACQTFLERVMPMVFNGFVVTTHAVIASVVASLLLPQEYC